MTYTTAQILAAAEAAEVSMIDAQHICDTLVKMNPQIDCSTCKFYDVYITEEPCSSCDYIFSNHEPTTETF